MKKILFLLFLIVSVQASAQFSYSVKAGWTWQKSQGHLDPWNWDESCFALGASVDYAINPYIGLQSGLNYKRMKYIVGYSAGGRTPELDDAFTREYHYAEIPLLFTASVIPTPQRWRTIVNAGMFVDIPVEGPKEKQVYYGVMTALQIEILSHYFIRGEYQWALSSFNEDSKDYRVNRLNICLGYRF